MTTDSTHNPATPRTIRRPWTTPPYLGSPDGSDARQVKVRMRAETLAILNTIAAEQGKPRSQIICEILNEHAEAYVEAHGRP